jgi:beta-glucosidase
MTRHVRFSFVLLLLVLSSVLIFPTATVFAVDQKIPAIVPAPQTAGWWMPQHERNVARVRQGAVDLLMIGDSITQGWGDEGRRVWERYYAHRRAVNLGFNRDRTEQVLWRLQHGEIDGIHPKVAVVMIGTNNSGTREDPAEETTAGVKAVVTLLRARLPEAKILLLGIFPRGATSTDSIRLVNESINARLRGFADGQHLFYLDLGHLFLDRDGGLKRDLMPDLLHPNEQGYRLWAEGMEAQLKALLGE